MNAVHNDITKLTNFNDGTGSASAAPVRRRISKKPTKGLLNRTLPREVLQLGDNVWRVARFHRLPATNGYIVVKTGDIIRCECRIADKGLWCSHRVTIWALLDSRENAKLVKWHTDHRFVDAPRAAIETLYSILKRTKARFTISGVYADKAYLSEGSGRG